MNSNYFQNQLSIISQTRNINENITESKTAYFKLHNKEIDFKLSDDNVMEFFLEYDKHNKENMVRIVTDYGNIEIELFLS